MSTESCHFLSEARHEKSIEFFDETRRGMVLIRLQLYKLSGSGWMDEDAYEEIPVARDVTYKESPIWTESHFWISLSSLRHLPERRKHTELFKEVLEDWSVPKPQQPAIVAQLFQAVDGSGPKLSIVVAVRSLALRLRTVISYGYDATELNPTAESSTFVEDGLKKSGATEYKTTTSCVLCMEGFFEYDSGVQQLTRLPCSHCYHGHCLLQWPSEISRSCPLCTKPKSKFDAFRQFWVGMVKKHAGTVISALIFCQFFKPTLQVLPLETSPVPAPPKSWRQSLLEIDESLTNMASKCLNEFQNLYRQPLKEGETKWRQNLEEKEVPGSEATISMDRNYVQVGNTPTKGESRHI